MVYVSSYRNISVNVPDISSSAVNVHYVEAGAPTLPPLLLLHGFPSSSNQFRDFIPMLSDSYHVLAPDMPGFGLTRAGSDFVYTFDHLAAVISAFLVALQVTQLAMYIFDYGAPVGLRLALQNPDSIRAIISQNGNAYVEGFGYPHWDAVMELWRSNNSATQREYVREHALTLESVKAQYTTGFPESDRHLTDPNAYTLDFLTNVNGKANQDRQLDLYYDYRTNVAMYPAFQRYFRDSQVPLLAVWGKNDPSFRPPGAEAFKRDLPDAIVRFVDAGHFALETKRWEIVRMTKDFLTTVGF